MSRCRVSAAKHSCCKKRIHGTEVEHTLLLSMTVFTGMSSPAGNLYWGNRFDRMSDNVFVLTVEEWEVRYLPCAEGTCSAMGSL